MWYRKKNKGLMPATEALMLSQKNKLLRNLEQQAKELATLIKDIESNIEYGHVSAGFTYLTEYQKQILDIAGYKIIDNRKWFYQSYYDEKSVPLSYPRRVEVAKKEDVPKHHRPEFGGVLTVSWDNT